MSATVTTKKTKKVKTYYDLPDNALCECGHLLKAHKRKELSEQAEKDLRAALNAVGENGAEITRLVSEAFDKAHVVIGRCCMSGCKSPPEWDNDWRKGTCPNFVLNTTTAEIRRLVQRGHLDDVLSATSRHADPKVNEAIQKRWGILLAKRATT